MPNVIYAIRCSRNGKVYIGRTKNLERRMHEHLMDLKKGRKGLLRNPTFQADFDRYGEAAFEVYILERCVPSEYVRERENSWIQQYKSSDPRFGYNILDGLPPKGFSRVSPGLPPNLSKRADIK